MEPASVQRLADKWQGAQKFMIDRGSWYRLAGRDFANGMDCSGYVGYVLSEIGLALPLGAFNTVKLYRLPIWVDKPDSELFGSYARMFEVAFTDEGSGPVNGLAHTAIRYNYSYWSHVSGGYFNTGHQNSIEDVLRNVDAIYDLYADGSGVFQSAPFLLDMADFLKQDRYMNGVPSPTVTPTTIEVEDGVNFDVLGLVMPNLDMKVPDAEGKDSNVSLYFRALFKNFAMFGGLYGFMKDIREIQVDGGGAGVDLNVPRSLVDAIATTFQGLERSEAVEWVMNQLTSKDVASSGAKNGIQTFPNDHLTFEVRGGAGTLTKYLGGPKFHDYFMAI